MPKDRKKPVEHEYWNVAKIVERWLEENGYDGLYLDVDGLECSCGVDDIASSYCYGNVAFMHCVPAKRNAEGYLEPICRETS